MFVFCFVFLEAINKITKNIFKKSQKNIKKIIFDPFVVQKYKYQSDVPVIQSHMTTFIFSNLSHRTGQEDFLRVRRLIIDSFVPLLKPNRFKLRTVLTEFNTFDT